MKLLDVRKYNIKQSTRVRFQLPSGMECVVNEHGISQTPELNGPPDFNLEEEFAKASRFVVETVPASGKQKEKVKSQTLSREELENLVSAGAGSAKAHEDHEE